MHLFSHETMENCVKIFIQSRNWVRKRVFQFWHILRFRGTACVSTDTFWRDFRQNEEGQNLRKAHTSKKSCQIAVNTNGAVYTWIVKPITIEIRNRAGSGKISWRSVHPAPPPPF